MKPQNILAVVSILASSAFAQTPGFFVSAGGGQAWMDVGHFVVYNPDSSVPGTPGLEALAAKGTKDTVSVVRLTVGYAFDKNWDLQLAYANYGTGEVDVALANYPGAVMFPGGDQPIYTRNVFRYKPSAFTLMPSYTCAIGDNWRARAGAGVSYGVTTSHFETTVLPSPLTFPDYTRESYAGETDRRLGYVVSLGVDYLFTKNLSVGVTGSFSTFKTKVPSSPWWSSVVMNSTFGPESGTAPSVNINSYGVELALTWHW